MDARQLASKPTEARDSPQVSIKSSGPPSKPIRLTRQRKLRYEFLTPEFLTPSQQPRSLTLSRYNFFFFFPFFFLSFFLFIYLWISCRWLNLTWISFSFIRRLLSLSLCLWLSSPFQNHFPFWTFRFILFSIEHLGQLWWGVWGFTVIYPAMAVAILDSSWAGW